MKCPNCNAEVADGSAHCTSCGAALSAPEAVEEAAAELVDNAAAEPVAPPVAAPQEAPKKKVSFLKTLFSGKDAEDEAPAPAESAEAAPAQPADGKKEKKEVSLEELTKPAGVFRFLGMLIVLAVPILGIIMLFKWAFGWGVNKNVRNYSRAMLLFILLMVVLYIVILIVWPEGIAAIGQFIEKIAAFKFITAQ